MAFSLGNWKLCDCFLTVQNDKTMSCSIKKWKVQRITKRKISNSESGKKWQKKQLYNSYLLSKFWTKVFNFELWITWQGH